MQKEKTEIWGKTIEIITKFLGLEILIDKFFEVIFTGCHKFQSFLFILR